MSDPRNLINEERILAVASEAGSSKAILPVLLFLSDHNSRFKAFLHPSVVELFCQFSGSAEQSDIHSVTQNLTAQDIIENFRPAVILIGTSPNDSLDRQVTLFAKEHNIPVLNILDERYGYRRRFSDHRNRLKYLPDAIAVMDEQCRRNAISEGIPQTNLNVTGSPILSFLYYNANKYMKKLTGSINKFDPSWKQVMFISETFKRDNGYSPNKPGAIGEFFGFTEETVRQDLIYALDTIDTPVVIVEKLHPSQEEDPKEFWIRDTLYFEQVKKYELWPLLMESDVVVGMRSMALLEAGLLRRKTASYQPNLIGPNKCAAVHFGVVEKLENRDALKSWLGSSLSGKIDSTDTPIDLPFIKADATEQVVKLINKLLHERK